MKKAKKTSMWILCEAFAMTGDASSHNTVHETLSPWAGVYPSFKASLDALVERVRERVAENYEGRDDADEKTEDDVARVLARGDRFAVCRSAEDRKVAWRTYAYRYCYSTDDREVVWRIYARKV